MNNTEHNQTQDNQQKDINKGNIKEPQTETSEIPTGQAKSASENQKHQTNKTSHEEENADDINDDNDVNTLAKMATGIDVENDVTMDSTVNTDGKMSDAKYGAALNDTINSNATTENNVFAPAFGLGGIDSRPEKNGLLMLHPENLRYVKTIETFIFTHKNNPQLTERVHVSDDNRHLPHNHSRVEHLFELVK